MPQALRYNRTLRHLPMTLKEAINYDLGAALQGFALRLAPAVAATYAAGYVAGEAYHRLLRKVLY